MRIQCSLRELRGDRSLRKMQIATKAAGHEVSAGILSQIERGVMLPTDAQLPALEQAYGQPAHRWYAPKTLLVIQSDDETG